MRRRTSWSSLCNLLSTRLYNCRNFHCSHRSYHCTNSHRCCCSLPHSLSCKLPRNCWYTRLHNRLHSRCRNLRNSWYILSMSYYIRRRLPSKSLNNCCHILQYSRFRIRRYSYRSRCIRRRSRYTYLNTSLCTALYMRRGTRSRYPPLSHFSGY